MNKKIIRRICVKTTGSRDIRNLTLYKEYFTRDSLHEDFITVLDDHNDWATYFKSSFIEVQNEQ